eukprot:10556001-Lingulodinium_polyedra.AAC.1
MRKSEGEKPAQKVLQQAAQRQCQGPDLCPGLRQQQTEARGVEVKPDLADALLVRKGPRTQGLDPPLEVLP